MKLKIQETRRRTGAYTLIEALVAGVVLMIGVSAASALTLALITQDEMNERTCVALNYQENAASLYRLGLSESQIEALLPPESVVSDLTMTTGTESVAHTPAVPGLPSASVGYADVTITFNPSPATQSWTGGIWTGGGKSDSRTITQRAYRSDTSITIP
ncbi:MAG: hypothetical protein KDN19_05025 [Verrucomicrobiae bacterium]|nr:hypothetical protein [Verrucomicrobiae bacterium]